jgi:hypothetical protein
LVLVSCNGSMMSVYFAYNKSLKGAII